MLKPIKLDLNFYTYIFIIILIKLVLLNFENNINFIDSYYSDAGSYKLTAFEYYNDHTITEILLKLSKPTSISFSLCFAIVYKISFYNENLMNYVTIIVSILNIFLFIHLYKKIWNYYPNYLILLSITFFPTVFIFSIIPLKETFFLFFSQISLILFIKLIKKPTIKNYFLNFPILIILLHLHVIALSIIITFVILILIDHVNYSYKNFKVPITYNLNIILLFLFILFTNIFDITLYFPKIKTLSIESLNYHIIEFININTIGNNIIPKSLLPRDNYELFILAPIRALYMMFGPFSFEINSLKKMIFIFDQLLLVICLTSIILLYSKKKIKLTMIHYWIILSIIFFIIFLAFSQGNFGNISRHKAKIFILLLLFIPDLKSLIFNYNNSIKK